MQASAVKAASAPNLSGALELFVWNAWSTTVRSGSG
jgi:hypothetical protein